MPDNTKLNTERLRACDGEDIWRTINGAKVLIDEGTGEIKGGAGGKLNGKKFKPSFGKSLKPGRRSCCRICTLNSRTTKGPRPSCCSG